MLNETGPFLSSKLETPHSFGIKLYYRNIPILPQAVGGILTQAMYKAFLERGPTPFSVTNGFQHSYSEMIEEKICFDVGINMTANTNLTGIYAMTNTRVATVLSLMGFDFAHHEDLTSLREYEFAIFVDTVRGETIIGRGTLKNGQAALRPVLSHNRLLWPRCSRPPAANSRRSSRD